MSTHVVIPTMHRHENLKVAIPKWLNHFDGEDTIDLYVAASEWSATDSLAAREGWPENVQVRSIHPSVQGIGAIRNYIVDEQAYYGRDVIIMSDDDIFPSPKAEFHDPFIDSEYAMLGVGCVTSYHSLLLGDRKDMMKGTDLIFARSGYGFRMFWLNVPLVMGVGNFDKNLDVCFEDAELMRQGVSNGLTWWLDPYLKASPLGKRFAEGGLAAYTGDPETREERTQANYDHLYELWPQYIKEPPSRRMAWQRMLNDYIAYWQEL